MIPYKLPKINDNNNDLSKPWFVYYSYLNPESHKFERWKIHISSKLKTKGARRERAQAIIRDYSIKLQNGFNPYTNEIYGITTVIIALKASFKRKKKGLRPSTQNAYMNVINVFENYIDKRGLQNISLNEFSYIHARNFMDWVRIYREASNRTYNNYRTLMMVFFNDMVEREEIMVNPFKKVKTLPEEAPNIARFTDEEILIIRNALPVYDYNLYALAMLIYYLFMRPAEIMKLQIKDFNLETGELIIRSEVSKNRRYCTLTMPVQLVKILKKLNLKKFPDYYYVFSDDFKPGEAEKVPRTIHYRWEIFTKKYYISRSIYKLKHTAVGKAMQNGIDARDLQLQLRHHSLDMTQKYLDKFGNKDAFLGTAEQLVNKSTLDALINAKAGGATFGALSEGELRLLQGAATKLGAWALRDDSGRLIGFDVDEGNFKKELNTVKELANKQLQANAGGNSAEDSVLKAMGYSDWTGESPEAPLGFPQEMLGTP